MKFSHVLFLALALGAGVMIGRKTSESSTSVQEEKAPPPVCSASEVKSNCAEFENLKQHLQGVSPEQIREYLRTQNAEEKLKKADQILAQIMQVLVADIGFRLQKDDVDQLGRASVTFDNQPPPTKVAPAIDKKEAKEKAARKIRFEVRNAASDEEARKVLTDLGTGFSERLQGSGLLSREELRNLIGHFEGSLTYSQSRRQPVRITMDFQGQSNGKDIKGTAAVIIYSEKGIANSEARSSGSLSSSYTGTENSVFVKVGGSYLELVYFPGLDLWMGSYLESDRGLLQKAGDVVLRRQ
jgi:hypothetical protein